MTTQPSQPSSLPFLRDLGQRQLVLQRARNAEVLDGLRHGRALVRRLDYAEVLTLLPDDGDVPGGPQRPLDQACSTK